MAAGNTDVVEALAALHRAIDDDRGLTCRRGALSPVGEGSQFDYHPDPGLRFWTWMSVAPSAL